MDSFERNLSSVSRLKFRSFGYRFPLLGIAVVLVGAVVAHKTKGFSCVLFNLALLLASLVECPVSGVRSDMILAIENALNNWSRGLDPYLPGQIGGVPVSYGYLPGILISHFPAWALSVDLRWNNIIYRALWLTFLGKKVESSRSKEANLAFHYLAFSPYINYRNDLYFEMFIFLLVLYFQSPFLRFVTLPLMVVTRQWAWIIAPFLFFDDCFKKPKELSRTALGYLLGGLFTILLVAGFLWSRTSWSNMTRAIFWFQNVITDPSFHFDYGLNLKYLFLKLGVVGWMQGLQVATLVVLFIYSVMNPKLKGQLLGMSLISWILFVVLNGHFWLYLWNSVIVFSILVLIEEQPRQSIA